MQAVEKPRSKMQSKTLLKGVFCKKKRKKLIEAYQKMVSLDRSVYYIKASCFPKDFYEVELKKLWRRLYRF